MTFSIDAFLNSLHQTDTLSDTLPPTLRAIWHGLRGHWDTAHALVQTLPSKEGAWIHAWLHRIEGDLENADYWYHKAGRSRAIGDLEEEGKAIARALLNI